MAEYYPLEGSGYVPACESICLLGKEKTEKS